MADQSVAPTESRTWDDIRFAVIDELHDLRALACAGRALGTDSPDEEKHYMGRILGRIDILAGDLIHQLDDANMAQTNEGGAA